MRFVFKLKIKLFNQNLLRTKRRLESDLESRDLDELNLKKRISLVQHAFNNTKFYSKKYSEFNIDLNKNNSLSFFNKLPVVTRDDIKYNFNDFVANNVTKKNLIKATTGGSTGIPLTVLHDRRFRLAPVHWRVLKWWGINPWDNVAFIYRENKSSTRKIINNLIWWPTKRVFLDASNMDNQSMTKFVNSINKTKPKLIQGYIGAVYEFALFIKKNKLKVHTPNAIWVTSAPMTTEQRSVIQEIFDAPVYDQYGTCEIMWISAECKKQDGLHMMQDIRHIEFVDENNLPVKEGEWGKILLTDLENYAFPLIRYEIGDIGRYKNKKCSCGIKLPLMDNVKGRQSDVIQSPSGIKVSGEFLTTIFDDFPNSVRQFQIVQEEDYSIKLYYVPTTTNRHDIIKIVTSKLKDLVKNEIPVESIKVNEIPHDKGKTKFIISHIN